MRLPWGIYDSRYRFYSFSSLSCSIYWGVQNMLPFYNIICSVSATCRGLQSSWQGPPITVSALSITLANPSSHPAYPRSMPHPRFSSPTHLSTLQPFIPPITVLERPTTAFSSGLECLSQCTRQTLPPEATTPVMHSIQSPPQVCLSYVRLLKRWPLITGCLAN